MIKKEIEMYQVSNLTSADFGVAGSIIIPANGHILIESLTQDIVTEIAAGHLACAAAPSIPGIEGLSSQPLIDATGGIAALTAKSMTGTGTINPTVVAANMASIIAQLNSLRQDVISLNQSIASLA